jgi:hypothetical protein
VPPPDEPDQPDRTPDELDQPDREPDRAPARPPDRTPDRTLDPAPGDRTLTRSLSPRTKRQVRLILFGAAIIGALLGLGTLQLHLTEDPLADVHAYYDAATRLNNGEPLYPPDADTNENEYYRYPPLLAIAFRPLAANLTFEQAAFVWMVVVVVTFGLTLQRLGLRRPETWLAVGMLASPIAWSIAVGQAQVPVTWLLTIGNPAAVALAANLKVLPLLAAIYWVGRRDVRALAELVAAMAILGGIQLVLEPQGTIDFLRNTNLSQVGEVRNLSPYAISPALWAVLVVVGAVAALRLARTRYGWAAAVAFSVLATPRLLTYMLMTLLACLKRDDGEPDTERQPASTQ